MHAKVNERGSVVQLTAPHLAAKPPMQVCCCAVCKGGYAERLVTVLQGRPSHHTSALDAQLPPQQLGLLPGLQAERCSQL